MNGDEGGPSDDRRRIVVSSPFDVCAFVDDLGSDAVGELVLTAGGRSAGTVFVERGRICWAAARGMARRFTELLVAHTGGGRDVVDRVVLDCVVDRAPLGERLLEAQVVSAEQLRATILQHTAESLSAACADQAWGTWTPRRMGGYASRFVFSTVEVLVRTVAEESPHDAREGHQRIVDALAPDEPGAAFVRREGRGAPLPVAVVGAWPGAIHALLCVGRWAVSALDVAAEAGSDPFVAVTRASRCFTAWADGRWILVGLTTDARAGEVLRRRERAEEGRRNVDGRL